MAGALEVLLDKGDGPVPGNTFRQKAGRSWGDLVGC